MQSLLLLLLPGYIIIVVRMAAPRRRAFAVVAIHEGSNSEYQDQLLILPLSIDPLSEAEFFCRGRLSKDVRPVAITTQCAQRLEQRSVSLVETNLR
jgi:hypothetical protein